MYCDTRTLEDRITGSILAGFVPETGEDRERVLSGYCERAGARVDAMLSIRYATPVDAPPLLRDIASTFALWQIAADRGNFADKLPAGIQTLYDEAYKTLADIAAGRLDLAGADGADGATAGLQVVSPATRIAPDSPGMEWF